MRLTSEAADDTEVSDSEGPVAAENSHPEVNGRARATATALVRASFNSLLNQMNSADLLRAIQANVFSYSVLYRRERSPSPYQYNNQIRSNQCHRCGRVGHRVAACPFTPIAHDHDGNNARLLRR